MSGWLRSDLGLAVRLLSALDHHERRAFGRFVASIRFTETCWIWVGPIGSNGYGRFWDGGHRTAHRWLYERLVGPIPDGLVLDHLSRVRHCVNPEHLEPVTSAENTRRGFSHGSKTHCPSGHEYDEANTRLYQGRRYCRACNNNGGEGRLTTGSRKATHPDAGGDPDEFRRVMRAKELVA